MTPDQLDLLGFHAKTSPEDADRYIDRLLQAHPSYGSPSNPRCLQCADLGVKLPELGQLELQEVHKQPFAQALVIAGVGPRLRAAREAGTDLQASTPKVDLAWLAQAEQDTTADPDVQALACLRLLIPSPLTHASPAVREMVQLQLSELLVRYPALLHPRIVFDLHAADGCMGVAEGLHYAHGALPCSLDGIDEEQLQALFLHPVMRQTLAPHLRRNGGFVFDLLKSQTMNPRLAASLLQIERANIAAGQPSALVFHGVGSLAFASFVGHSLTETWFAERRVDPIYDRGCALLLDEVRQCDTKLYPVLATCLERLQFLLSMSDEPAERITVRFDKLVHMLCASGLQETPDKAATMLVDHVFGRVATTKVRSRLDVIDSLAHAEALVMGFETAGADFDGLADAVKDHVAPTSAVWKYVHTQARLRVMEQVIERKGDGDSADAAPPAPAPAKPATRRGPL